MQQLAVGYVARGYWFYVVGCIPFDKDPIDVDTKLIDRYEIDRSKFSRCRRRKRGVANVQYLRFRRFFVLIATRGEHKFYCLEKQINDIRRRPIKCFGYSIGCYGRDRARCSVRIERELFHDLKAAFVTNAL
jgi:hypothetical protein